MTEVSPPSKSIGLERAILLIGATLIAVASARFAAGSWHDGSRLATVECLVDYHTLAIDDSIFVRMPVRDDPSAVGPDATGMAVMGTMDRVQINGRFYSHQPPTAAFLLAVEYQVWKWITGKSARGRPDLFYFVMTLGSSGLGYVVAVGCIHALATRLDLSRLLRLCLPISLAVSTTALAYVRNVNNHMMLLGVASAVTYGLTRLALRHPTETVSRGLCVWLGIVSGLGYAMDSAVGASLLLCTCVLVTYRTRRFGAVALFVMGSVPWILLHHVVNYAVGGTIRPYGAVAEYLAWPDSAFDASSMTGVYNHASPLHFGSYALGLLVGGRGFLIHNPPMLLAVVGAAALMLRRPFEFPEVLWALGWSVATWLVYALFSNNSSGQCLSIRWFIPLLAPGYLVLAVFLKHFPRYSWAFLLISAWGAFFAVDSWTRGPWRGHAHSQPDLRVIMRVAAARHPSFGGRGHEKRLS